MLGLMTRWLSSGGQILQILKGLGEGARNKVMWLAGAPEEWEGPGSPERR